MALINQLDKYHLCYLILNDISDDCLNGLSHVAEHTLLLHSNIEIGFLGCGYTSASHVWLYFASDKLEALLEIDRKLMNGEIITDENVSKAKRQVVKEIYRLQEYTAQCVNLIRFITEDRIEKFAIGEVEQINKIHPDDIRNWFNERKSQHQIYRFIFKDAHKMIASTKIHKNCMRTDKFFCDCITIDDVDRLLILTPMREVASIQLFFRIPPLDSKEAVISKTVFEFCIQRKLHEAIGIDIEISDVFFDINERFSVIKFQWNDISMINEILRKIRLGVNGIDLREYHAYKEEFKQITATMVKQKKTNSEMMNDIKNYVVYSLPSIQPEDIDYIDQIKFEQFPRELITKTPLKIVIR